VFKDFSNHFGIFDGGNDLHVAAAFDAGFNINIEDPCQQPCPGNVFLFQLPSARLKALA
jgi:hypothetical protein